jgi:hypothetical protein
MAEHSNLTPYQTAARSVVAEFGTWNLLGAQAETLVVLDDASGNYLAVIAGWDDDEPVYHPLVHLRVRGNQVIVVHNATDEEIDRLLLEAGVAYQDIAITKEQEQQSA